MLKSYAKYSKIKKKIFTEFEFKTMTMNKAGTCKIPLMSVDVYPHKWKPCGIGIAIRSMLYFYDFK